MPANGWRNLYRIRMLALWMEYFTGERGTETRYQLICSAESYGYIVAAKVFDGTPVEGDTGFCNEHGSSIYLRK